MSSADQPSIAKQILGAGIGMLIAVAVYQGYEMASPALEAALASYLPSASSVAVASGTAGPLSNDKVMQIAQRAREIMQKHGDVQAGTAR